MNVDIKHKRNLHGFTEQDFPYQCPECKEELKATDIIGFNKYPKGGYRQSMKPHPDNMGAGFECPKCFTKSVCHADESTYQMFEDNLKIDKIK